MIASNEEQVQRVARDGGRGRERCGGLYQIVEENLAELDVLVRLKFVDQSKQRIESRDQLAAC
jgi:hypothetical protein